MFVRKPPPGASVPGVRGGRAGISKAGGPGRARSALLQGGAELLLEDAERSPFAGLRVRGVCERAGYSAGAFYVHWPDSSAYHDALSRYLLAEDAGHFEAEFALLAGLAEACETDNPAGAVLALADADLGALLANPLWDAIQLFGLTWGRDRHRGDAAEGYRDIDRVTARIHGTLIERLGREVRPPLDAEQLGTLLQALIEGCASRHRVDPAAIDRPPHPSDPEHYLYAAAVAALLAVLTRPAGDPRDLPATLAHPRPTSHATAPTTAATTSAHCSNAVAAQTTPRPPTAAPPTPPAPTAPGSSSSSAATSTAPKQPPPAPNTTPRCTTAEYTRRPSPPVPQPN